MLTQHKLYLIWVKRQSIRFFMWFIFFEDFVCHKNTHANNWAENAIFGLPTKEKIECVIQKLMAFQFELARFIHLFILICHYMFLCAILFNIFSFTTFKPSAKWALNVCIKYGATNYCDTIHTFAVWCVLHRKNFANSTRDEIALYWRIGHLWATQKGGHFHRPNKPFEL